MDPMLPTLPTEKRESVSLIRRRVQSDSSIFGAGAGTDFTESRLPAPAPSGVVFFAFDGGIISDAVTAVYGEYAETSLLEAFFETVKRVGDWHSIQRPAGIMGCHGDLIDGAFMPSAPALQNLRSWLCSGKFDVDVTRLDPGLEATLRATGPLESRVFLIGLVGLKNYALVEADRRLRNGAVGYLGYFTLQGIPLHEAADKLSLVVEPKICGDAASGWIVNPENIRRLRLREIPAEEGISADVAYLFPALVGDESCFPSARQSFRGQASRVTSMRRYRGRRTSRPNFANHAELHGLTPWLDDGENWNSSATPTTRQRSGRVEFVSQAAHFGDN